jgi:hypothetical protein
MTMKNLVDRSRFLQSGILLLGLLISTSVLAHDIRTADGQPTHKHVYKKSAYGNGVVTGHYAQPAGSKGIVIWRSSPNRSYAKAQPGFRVPSAHRKQPSAKQIHQQKPTFTKEKRKAPDLKRK